MTANDFRNLIASVYDRRASLADCRPSEVERETVNLRSAVERLEGARPTRANADLSAQAAVALERARATLAKPPVQTVSPRILALTANGMTVEAATAAVLGAGTAKQLQAVAS